MTIDPRDFLDAVSGYTNNNQPKSSANVTFKLGTVDPYYSSGLARVLVDGESVMSERGYAWTTFSPLPGSRVLLAPVGTTYIIVGIVSSISNFANKIALPLASNFAIYDSVTFHPPQLYKTVNNYFRLEGLVKHNSITGVLANGTLIATIPEQYRPTTTLFFPCVTSNVTGVIEVRPDGQVLTKKNCNGIWISLNNIGWTVDDSLTWTTPTILNSFDQGALSLWTRPVQYTKDSLNRVFFRGSFGESGTAKAVDTAFINLPAGIRPSPQPAYEVMASVLGAGDGFAHSFSNHLTGDVTWRTGSGDDDEVSVDAITYPPLDVTWTNITTFLNSWVSFGATNTPGWYKDEDGLVHLRGLVKSGTINTPMFNLSTNGASYPGKNIPRITVSNGTPSRIDIRSNGDVVAVTGSNLWVSLDGISFSTSF